MTYTTNRPRKVGVLSPHASDLKKVGRELFPEAPTSKRLEAISRLMGFGSAAAYQAAIHEHPEGQRFELPTGDPILDSVLEGFVGHSDMERVKAVVDRVIMCLEQIGYIGLQRLIPTLLPTYADYPGSPFSELRSEFGEKMPGPYAFNKMIYTDVQYVSFEDSPVFSDAMFSGDTGAGVCDRFWIGRTFEEKGHSWAHPVLEATLRRAIRNPDYVEWIVEESVRSAGASDGVRCEREVPGYAPVMLVTPDDVEQHVRDEIAVVKPYLESMAKWLHETSPEWRAPEDARLLLKGHGHASMSLNAARDLVEGMRDYYGFDAVLNAKLAGLSQCTLPLDPHGGLPLPDFCLAAGMGLLANPASVDRPSADELEKAVRKFAEDLDADEAYAQLVIDPDVIDVLAREVAVSRERGIQALHVRIEMSVG